MLLELKKFGGELDVWLQEVLGILSVGASVGGVLLDIQTDGSSRAASARQADDDAGAVRELHVQALVRGDAAVEIGV